MVNAGLLLTQFIYDFGSIVLVSLASILGFLAALLGLGWGVSAFLRNVVGDSGGFVSPYSEKMMKSYEYSYNNKKYADEIENDFLLENGDKVLTQEFWYNHK